MACKEYLNEKDEFIMLDFFRIIGAALVVSIHIAPFADINPTINFWLQQILARIAVPFFFTTSGFFIYTTIECPKKFLNYIKRISMLYILYTALYLPQIVHGWLKSGYSIRNCIKYFIRNSLISGSYTHLWYFLALIVASILLYLMINHSHLSAKKIIGISAVLYGIGVLGDAYQNLFLEMPLLGSIMSTYYEIFTTTRNGLFFGFFFVSLGYMIRKYNWKIANKNSFYLKMTILMFFLMNIEEYWAKDITGHYGQNMIFTTPLVVFFLFLTIVFTHLDSKYNILGIYIRKLSVLIFGFHLFVKFYIEIIIPVFSEWSSWLQYLIILIISSVLGMFLIRIQKIKAFDCIKYLY